MEQYRAGVPADQMDDLRDDDEVSVVLDAGDGTMATLTGTVRLARRGAYVGPHRITRVRDQETVAARSVLAVEILSRTDVRRGDKVMVAGTDRWYPAHVYGVDVGGGCWITSADRPGQEARAVQRIELLPAFPAHAPSAPGVIIDTGARAAYVTVTPGAAVHRTLERVASIDVDESGGIVGIELLDWPPVPDQDTPDPGWPAPDAADVSSSWTHMPSPYPAPGAPAPGTGRRRGSMCRECTERGRPRRHGSRHARCRAAHAKAST